MTIQEWNILLDAVIAILLIFYGFWLKNVIDQQLKAKDTAREALEAVIKSKEAEISRLSGNTAPAIVRDYAVMKQHANDMTEQKLRLSEDVKKLSTQLQQKEMVAPVRELLLESKGILIAELILNDNVGEALFSRLPEHEWKISIVDSYSKTLEQMEQERKNRRAKADVIAAAPNKAYPKSE